MIRINNFFENNNDKINEKHDNYEKIMFIYKAALKILKTKVEILNEQYDLFYEYKPIEYITTRIKSEESIKAKLKRKKMDLTYQNMFEEINDIAGIRIVCNFKDDVYKIVEEIENFQDIRILKKKDYMKKPKTSGYMSYHIVVEVPINFVKETLYVKAEIQVRTIGMDFWANLEHKLKYKNDAITKKQSKELVKYAKLINNIDDNMLLIANQNAKQNQIAVASEVSNHKKPIEKENIFKTDKFKFDL